MLKNWPRRFAAWLSNPVSRAVRRRSRFQRGNNVDRTGAMVAHLETLESRQMLTNLVAVSTIANTVYLTDISGYNASTGDNISISYSNSQVVLTGQNGTSFKVGDQTLSSYTANVSGPGSISMFLSWNANTVSLTGDGTSSLASLNVNLGLGQQNNSLTFTKVIADSVSISAGGDNNAITLSQSTINNDLWVGTGYSTGDSLDLESTTVKGNVTDYVGKLIMDQSTISGKLYDVQLGDNDIYSSTDSIYVGDMSVIMGPYGVVNYYYSPMGASHTEGKVTFLGFRHQDIAIYVGETTPGSVAAATIKYDNYPDFTHASMIMFPSSTASAPTVNNLAAATTTPTITGTFSTSTANSPVFTVAVNGVTYTLGTSPQLTSPTAGTWALNLGAVGSTAAAPLPTTTSTFTVTATMTDKLGNQTTAIGTVTNEQAIMSTYLTTNKLTGTPLSNGVNYVVTTAGTGAVPKSGQMVTATYSAYVLNSNGTMGATPVDTNTTGQQFTLSNTGNFVGLDSALESLAVGSSATVLIPSSLAYGANGGTTGTGSTVPANSILVYQLKILSSQDVATPTVNNLAAATTTPTITGTYDSVNSQSFAVSVNGTTYTLGTSPQLTTPSAGTWALNLGAVGSTAAAPLPTSTSTFTVTATSTDKTGAQISGTGTVTNEQAIMNTYLTSNKLTATPLSNGVNYVVTTAGTGAVPKTGQMVTATYSAYVLFPNGILGTFPVDTNTTGQTFTLNNSGNFVGLDSALESLAVGSTATILIPSSLGYAANGATTGTGSTVPANSILVYQLKLISIQTVAAPTVNNLIAATTTPTITGTYDSVNSQTFAVSVNGTTYTLGSSPQLSSPSTGNWELDLAAIGGAIKAAPLPLNTSNFTVTATSTDSTGAQVSGTGTVTNEQATINTYVKSLNLPSGTSDQTTASGLNYIVTTPAPANSPIPKNGQWVTVNYSGFLLNSNGTQGSEFDSNTDSSFGHVSPFVFQLGRGSVIAGWDEAFALLPVGSVATLIIPSSLAYGASGQSPTIPANSILIFKVTVVAASNASQPTVNSPPTASTTPTITGTYDATNSAKFTVGINGTTYTLGTDPQLTQTSTGKWSLDLANSPLPTTPSTFTVTATSTDSSGGIDSGTGTVDS